jgi:hypothetical protein
MSETGGPATPEPRHGPGPEGTGGTVPQVPEYGGQQQWAAPPPNAPQWNPSGYGKPGIIPLRPLTLGEILDGAITLIRRYPRLVLGVSAIVAVINTVLVFFANWLSLDALRNLSPQMQQNRTPQEQLDQLLSGLGGLGLSTGAAALFTVLTTTFLSGFLTVVVGRAALGRPVSFRDALDELRPRLPRLLVLTIVYTVLVFVGALLCFLPGVWLYVLFGLATPALVLERGTVGEALRRSSILVRGSWWRVFGVLVLASLIAFVITALIGVPFGLVSGGLNGAFTGASVPTVGSLLLDSIGTLIAATITTPFAAAVTALLYIDQRMRKEGMDIELARAAGVAPQGPPPQA